MKTNCFAVALSFTVTAVCAWADAPSKPAAKPSLDDLLLGELDNQLLEGPDDSLLPPEADATKGAAKDKSPAKDDGAAPRIGPKDASAELDRMLLEQLGEGEDLGHESSDPLITIARRMRTVEQLIARRNTSETTQRIQKQIVADMERLIEQMKNKCAGGQCNNSGNKRPGKPSSGNKAGSGENRGSNKPAREATDRSGASQEDTAEGARPERMMKSVWGHLPPKVREQMQSGSLEEFLPKYQQLIEDYYTRLATERID